MIASVVYAMRRIRRAFCKTPLLQTNIGVHHFRCAPMRLLGYACIARFAARGIAAANDGLVTGLSSKPVSMQTVYILRDNANSDGLKGFSGEKFA